MSIFSMFTKPSPEYWLHNTERFLLSFENKKNAYEMKKLTKTQFYQWFLEWKPFMITIQNQWYNNQIKYLLGKKIIKKNDLKGLYE